MSYSYDRYERQRRQTYSSSTRRTAWGYWIPLAVTVTVATVGLAAWIWNERKEDEDDMVEPRPPPPGGYGGGPSSGFGGPPPGEPGYENAPPGAYGPPPPGEAGYSNAPPGGFDGPPPGQPPYAPGPGGRETEDESIVARMSGALRRTPSPQQIFDSASRSVVAGVTAAGAAVGGALSSIREEDKVAFEDHSRWSEEADSQSGGASSRKGPELRDLEGEVAAQQIVQAGGKKGGKRKTVAIVVSAETDYEHEEDAGYHQENASVLSHLPEHIDNESRVFVLIYAPDLKHHPLARDSQSGQPNLSLASSYSNIGHEDAQSPGETLPDPEASPARSKTFDTLYNQAQALVEKDTMIMPFTTPTGHIHILRHLGPETVYIQETLSDSGEVIAQISNWVGQVVLVVGDESGHGGLVDSEDESGRETKEKWWHDDPRIGLGKGVEVVDGLRVGEDFRRRVSGHE